ncbi:MAG TPA: hypothetical protein PLA24_03350 [Tenuifilaceae bacterium]|nr:hypothetical protein [Tenuifilaceae bacterium]
MISKSIKIFAITLLTGFSVQAFSQEENTNNFYKDSTGQLFVSPKTPVLLYMGTSNDPSKAVLLHGLNGKGNPLYWNGNGPQVMTHLNLYLGRKIKFELYADGIPPQTKIDVASNVSNRVLNNAIYVGGGAVIEITATDDESGLKSTYYSVNNKPYTKYTEPITFEIDGIYELKAYSTDELGNKEEEVSRKFIVDATPPTSTKEIKGDEYNDILSGKSTIWLNANDQFGVKEILYSIDSLDYQKYSVPLQTARLKQGDHVLHWYAIDLVNNKEPENEYKFYVDKTPPIVVEDIDGNTFMVGDREYSSGRSQLKIMAVDNKAGVKAIYYSLNSKEFKTYDKPVILSDIIGTLKVKTYAVDNVNNRSQSGANAESFTMPTIDITGPDVNYKIIGPSEKLRDTLWIGPTTKIQLTAFDKEAGLNHIDYSINQNEEKEYIEPFAITDNGFYSFNCTAYDNVENVNFLKFDIAVDNIPPEIYIHFSTQPFKYAVQEGESIPVFPSNVRIFLAATDNLSANITLVYSINNGKKQTYVKPISNLKAGLYTVTITATDGLKNIAETSKKFIIEH